MSKGARTKEEKGRGQGEGGKLKHRGEHATREPERFLSKREVKAEREPEKAGKFARKNQSTQTLHIYNKRETVGSYIIARVRVGVCAHVYWCESDLPRQLGWPWILKKPAHNIKQGWIQKPRTHHD